jgi:hypothetical protein
LYNLTPEEQSTILSYLNERGRADTFFSYAIYFVPSLLGLYGVWKADFAVVAVGYAVLFGLIENPTASGEIALPRPD